MPNVPVPEALKLELQRSGLVVWEAKRVRKGEPISLTLAGPGLEILPHGWGLTIEEAVDRALRSPLFLRTRPGLSGALARMEIAIVDLQWTLRMQTPGWQLDLDDDTPF